MGDLIGYARVSTTEQDPALQLDALKAAGCVRVFTDRASGAVAERAELSRAIDHLRAGDVFLVWRLDRLGRSLRHLIDIVQSLDVGGRVLRGPQARRASRAAVGGRRAGAGTGASSESVGPGISTRA